MWVKFHYSGERQDARVYISIYIKESDYNTRSTRILSRLHAVCFYFFFSFPFIHYSLASFSPEFLNRDLPPTDFFSCQEKLSALICRIFIFNYYYYFFFIYSYKFVKELNYKYWQLWEIAHSLL